MLCCLASLVTPNITEFLEASTRTAQGCSPAERDALLTFKSSVLDPSNRLASWDSYYDCCKWSGVVCRNYTTTMRVHVTELNLGNQNLYADERMALRCEKLSPSLLSLTHLEILNLSRNNFGGAQIPEFIGSFQKLRYLDLRECWFSGTVPPQIGNLTSLRYLDLSYEWSIGLRVQSLDWLMHLSCLTYLDMRYVNLSDVSRNWISTVNMLPSLQVLRLCECSLDQIPSFLSHLNLTSLVTLDLGYNYFNSTFPSWLWQLTALSYLDLRESYFIGTVPPQIGNLTNLRHLDLSDEEWPIGLRVQSLDWLMHLSCLTYLDMSNVNLSDVSRNWISTVNMLPSLQVLRLSKCSLDQIPSFLSHLNLTSLVTLDLGYNNFNSTFPSWLWQLTALSYLDLSNSFYGTIPAGIGNLRNLRTLSLSDSSFSGPLPNEIWILTNLTELSLNSNLLGGSIPIGIRNLTSLSQLTLYGCSLSGPIPSEIGNLTNLMSLDLSSNLLTGPIPVELGKLFDLTALDLSSNSLKGVVSQLFFANLTNLGYLDLSNNPLLTIAIDHNWVPPFQLQWLALKSLKLGPLFPAWLRSQTSISELYLSNASIEDNLPEWFWISSSSTFVVIDISHNKLRGNLPLSWENLKYLLILNLSSNLFEGSIPKLSPNLAFVDLSFNYLSGPLPSNFSSISYILSYNQINRSIPSSICNSRQLVNLDLSNNQISGEIPKCEWVSARYIRFLHLGNNNLTGEISSSIGKLSNIESLRLNSNNLHGEIPTSLQNCSNLLLLDLSNNKLFGSIPVWIGQSLQQLTVLSLRSNMFTSEIPSRIGQLSNLQIIDLANNYLIGTIPHSLGNLSALISTSKTMTSIDSFWAGTTTNKLGENDSITIVTKGSEYNFSSILSLVKSMDLSNNSLIGEIPKELGSLAGLQTLNISRNYLKGNIPNTISRMKSLETLDLSYNTLSGAIPQGISTLNSLNHLNLSYNNLSGMIPQGHQLQTLQDASIYKGNAYLCGAIINTSCSGEKNFTIIDEEHADSLPMLPNYLGITLGFLLGLWSVLIILLFKKKWRNFYFLMIDKIYNKAYVSFKISLNKWKKSQNFSTN